MSARLDQQLREYTASVDQLQEPVTAQEAQLLVSAVRELPDAYRIGERRQRMVLAMAGLFVLVLVMVGAVAVLSARPNESTPPATSPTSTTASPSTTAGSIDSPTTTLAAPSTTGPPVVTLPPPTATWEEIAFQESQGPRHGQVAAGSNQLLVLQRGNEGSNREDLDGDPRTILWTSPDGVEWRQRVLPQFESQDPWLVGEFNGMYVLHGWDEATERWTNFLSRDLNEWVTWEPIVDQRVGVMAATESAIVGAGWETLIRLDGDFTSPQVLEAPFGVAGDGGVMKIVSTEDRFYALVYSNTKGRSSVWGSPDGLEWEEELVDVPGAGAEQHMAAIAANSSHVLVYNDRGRTFFGPFWSAESGEPLVRVGGPKRAGEVTIAATDDGFFVTYTSGFGSGSIVSPTTAYTTTDGWSWGESPAFLMGEPAAVSSTLFGTTGTWEISFNADGTVAGETWVQADSWIIGQTRPSG